jgi:hypothetical protein
MKYSKINTPFEEEKNNLNNFDQNVNQNFDLLKDSRFTNEIGRSNISIQKLKNNLNPTRFSSIFNNEVNYNRNLNLKMKDNKRNKTNNFISNKGKKFI